MSRVFKNSANSRRRFMFLIMTLSIFAARVVAQDPSRLAGGIPLFSVTIDTVSDSKSFAVGEPLGIRITVKNTSDDVVNIARTCDARDYKVQITGPDGKSVTLTALGKRLTDRSDLTPCPRRNRILKSGETTLATLGLSQLYDLSSKGKYQVLVSRGGRGPDRTWYVVSSNTISFELK